MAWSSDRFIHEVISNLPVGDPRRERLLALYKPVGFGPVASSRHFVPIMSELLRGVHPEHISVMLDRECGEHVPASAIQQYGLTHIPPDLILTNMQLDYLLKRPGLSEIDTLDVLRKITLDRLVVMLDRAGRPRVIEPVVDSKGMTDGVTTIVETTELDGKIHATIDLAKRLAQASLDAKLKTGLITKHAEPLDEPGAVEETTLLDEDEQPFQMDDRTAAATWHILREMTVIRDKRVGDKMVDRLLAEHVEEKKAASEPAAEEAAVEPSALAR